MPYSLPDLLLGGQQVNPFAPLNKAAPQPAAEPDLSAILASLLEKPEPMGTGQRIGLAIADAMAAFGGQRPDATRTAVSRRQAEADRKTQLNMAGFQMKRADEARTRERGEKLSDIQDARAYTKAVRNEERDFDAEIRRQDRAYNESEADEAYRRGLAAHAADIGAIGPGDDPAGMTEAELLSAISKTKKADLTKFDQERIDSATSTAWAFFEDFTQGTVDPNSPVKFAPLSERLKTEKADDVMAEFQRRLRQFPGLPEEERGAMVRDLRKAIYTSAPTLEKKGPGPHMTETAIGSALGVGSNALFNALPLLQGIQEPASRQGGSLADVLMYGNPLREDRQWLGGETRTRGAGLPEPAYRKLLRERGK